MIVSSPARGWTYSARGHDDMRLFGQHGNQLVRHGGGAESDDGGAWGADHDVRTGTPRTARGCVEGTVADADEREDHGHFNGNGENTQQRADRAVPQIGEHIPVDGPKRMGMQI